MITLDEKALTDLLRPSKQQFTSVGAEREGSLSTLKLDESYELEEEEV